VRDGHDLRFYENVLLYVNKGRRGSPARSRLRASSAAAPTISSSTLGTESGWSARSSPSRSRASFRADRSPAARLPRRSGSPGMCRTSCTASPNRGNTWARSLAAMPM
jgi:hypothetical protein